MHLRRYRFLSWIYHRFGNTIGKAVPKKTHVGWTKSIPSKNNNLLIRTKNSHDRKYFNSEQSSNLYRLTIRAISTSISNRVATTTTKSSELDKNNLNRSYHRATKIYPNELSIDQDADHDQKNSSAATRSKQSSSSETPDDGRNSDAQIHDSSLEKRAPGDQPNVYMCKHAMKFQQQPHFEQIDRIGDHSQFELDQDEKVSPEEPSLQKPSAKPFNSIPGPKPSLPLVGTGWIYFPIVGHYQSMKLHEANMDKYYRYGPIMKEEYQPGHPTVTLFDPSDIKEVFVREGACPSRPVLDYVIKHRKSDPSRYPNVGLANMEGSEWLELRSRLAPLLLSKELRERHISTQNRVSGRLVNYIQSLLPALNTDGKCMTEKSETGASTNPTNFNNIDSGIVDNIQEVFYRFSMESIMNLCINQEIGCLKATSSDSYNAISSDGELIFQAAMNFFEAQHKLYYGLGTWKYFDSKPYRQLRDSQNAIHDIASKYVDVALFHLKNKRKSYSTNNLNFREEEHESLLETLYCTNKFSDLEIKSTIVDFVGGGIYTVANTLTKVLFLLASNSHVQDQLYQELCQVLGDDIHSDIDMDKLDQMKFLKLCLKESYRLLPTIPGVARTLNRDMILSNYLVPKNTLVFCNFMVTCRLPQYFTDPDEYNPSRWDRNGKHRDKDLAFCLLPFGHGIRKCIGHNFAELEIYVALAKLLRHFKIKTVNGENAESLNLCYKFIVVPEKPVTLEFIPRDHTRQNVSQKMAAC